MAFRRRWFRRLRLRILREGRIQVGDDLIKSGGALVRANLTVAKKDSVKIDQTDGAEVHREAILLADPEDIDARVNVVRLESGDYAQLVQDSEVGSARRTLEAIYEQNERIIMMLESIAE